jgi:hypothetical protein
MYTDYQWDAPAWMNRRLGRIVAAVLAAVLVLTVSAMAWSSTRSEPDKPASPQVFYQGIHVKKDHKFHIGLIDIDAAGKDVTVLRVIPTMTPNVEFLGAVTTYGMDEFQGGPGSAGPRFPAPYHRTTHPIGELIPAAKTSYIPAGRNKPAPVIVTAGFRLTSGTEGGVNGIRVVYRVGDKERSEFLRYAAVATTEPWRKTDKYADDHYENVLRSHGLLPPEDD